MNTNDLRALYLDFFEQRLHRRIPSAPLLPENDPTVLFTTAGMHPLVPYLLGEPHPLGKRLVNFQRCLRTVDIAEVGDSSHLTFFEMLGNWSLGDYFKAESLAWSHEFLIQALGIPASRLAVTVFAGDDAAPRDDESAQIWRSLGIPSERIFYLPREDNWWGPVGATGPCGPDSEIFVDTGKPGHSGCQPGCRCGKWLEIWNNVFMEYRRMPNGTYQRLEQRNVDTGMGVERTVAILNGCSDVFEIDTLRPLVAEIERQSGMSYPDRPQPFRVITDHVRAAALAIADGALPSNVEAGYITRRLLRRAALYGHELELPLGFCAGLTRQVVDLLSSAYPILSQRAEAVFSAVDAEERKFSETLERGLKQYEKTAGQVAAQGARVIPGAEAFNLFETYGFPLQLTVELARQQGLSVDEAGFEAEAERHRAISRQGAEQRFKGGLSDQSYATTCLHTASHLLQAALRQVLGSEVRQMGSNITPERLRFDFAASQRLSDEQMAQIEQVVNEQIARNLPVSCEIMPLEQALASGALAFFSEKYGEQVKVYTIGDFSREVCGGPHATRTGELGRFRVIKQEAVGQGVRRIRARLEPALPGA